MGMQARTATENDQSNRNPTAKEGPVEFPVREYIGAMAAELAQMARWDGDEALGRLLDSAAALAAQTVAHAVIERSDPVRPRPA